MKCPKCNTVHSKYPYRDENNKLIWKNIFRVSGTTIIMILLIAFMTWSYMHDTEECRKIIEKPCSYCANAGCCTADFINALVGEDIDHIIESWNNTANASIE